MLFPRLLNWRVNKMKICKFALVFVVGVFLITGSVSAQKVKTPKSSVELVQIEKFDSLSDGNGVYVRWNTAYEINTLGFNVYRENEKGRTLVNPSIIQGSALIIGDKREITGGNNYAWFDTDGTLSDTYYIESINTVGETKPFGPVYSQQVADISKVAGIDLNVIENKAINTNSTSETFSPALPKDLVSSKNVKNISTAQTTQFWVASQPGIKIGVKKEGVYRILRADLQTAGFNVGAALNTWQLYADGVEQPMIVEPNGNYIEFYGRGVDTLATDMRNYYLVVGTTNGKRIQSIFRRPLRENVVAKSFRNNVIKSENGVYLQSVLNGDEDNFFGSSFNSVGANFTVPTPNLDPITGKGLFEITIQGLTLNSHTVTVLLNGNEIGTLTGANRDSMSGTFGITSNLLVNGDNIVRLVSSGTGDYSLTDTIKITYSRRYIAAQNTLNFYVPNYMQTRIQGFASSNVRVFDITDAGNAGLISNTSTVSENGTFTAVIPSNRSRVFFAVEESGILSPVSIVSNTSSTLSNTSRNSNLLIISHSDFITQAETWANYRRNQGRTVEVINVEDVYDEFDFGTKGSPAIRNFLQYAYTNRQMPPRYIMLMGDAIFDGRNYLGRNLTNYVPASLVDTTFSQVGSDEALADFDDDGLSEIAIGRIPVKDAATATLIYNKTVSFETTGAAALSRGFMCVSDLPISYDFEAICTRVGSELPMSVPKTYINRGNPNGRSLVLSNMNGGRFLVNYAGHGNNSAWSSDSAFFNSNDLPTLTNTNQLAIFTLLTCLNGNYNNVYSDGLAKTAVKANGGAVAAWASSGETTADVQEIMAARFYSQVGVGNIERMGDAVKDAKTVLTYGRDVRLSWVLLGDPTLRIR
jgi:hypothetical protein